MRVAIISDIHGNADAFREVLCDIDQAGIGPIFCLGDNVGYGPEPEEVIQMIEHRNILSTLGNHELALLDSRHLIWFNHFAKLSLQKTQRFLTTNSITYIKRLKKHHLFFKSRFVHGFPPDSTRTYLFELSNRMLEHFFLNDKEKISFVGHTHLLELISFDGKSIRRSNLTKQKVKLYNDHKYIINVGSVGQPRDGNNQAKYIIWDNMENTVETRFVPYDIHAVIRKIRSLGLPQCHADCLL